MVRCDAIASAPPTCPICTTPLPAPEFHAPDRLHGTAGEFGVARCPRCGAGRTLPLLADAELGALYPSDYGPYDDRLGNPLLRAASASIRGWQAWSSWRSQPIAALRELTPGRGLDVGCGRGDLAVMLAEHGWRMSGVEPSPDACATAASRGIDAHAGTLATVALEPAAYGAIVFRHSLEHTNDPVGDLQRAATALAPGGLVLITVPNFGCLQARHFAANWYHLDLPRHRTHFTQDALREALTRAGLECVSTTTSTSALGLAASIQYRLIGRCAFPGGLSLRIAGGLGSLTQPLALALNAATGGGDQLNVVARRAMASSTSSATASAGPG